MTIKKYYTNGLLLCQIVPKTRKYGIFKKKYLLFIVNKLPNESFSEWREPKMVTLDDGVIRWLEISMN